jgi:cyclophilin family peptidyl-prolyl cis-trans isomerase
MLFLRSEFFDFAHRHTVARQFLAIVLAGCASGSTLAHQYVRMDYNLTLNTRSRHSVFLEVFDDRPVTQANFMQYVNLGKYDDSLIHRLSRNFVLQGGGFYPELQLEESLLSVSLDPDAEVDLDGNPTTNNPTIVNEYQLSPTRSNVKGTVAMAKVSGNPNSATSQWFVNLAANTGLDTNNGGFTVFAQVLGDGMSYFDNINSGTAIVNLNPDINDDGLRDGGPFFNYSAPLDSNGNPTDGVPIVGLSLLTLDRAKRIDYYGGTGASNILNLPAGGYTIAAHDAFIDMGATITGTGNLIVGAGRQLGIREGISVGRTLVNNGDFEIGLDNGIVTVPTYQQSATGSLEFDIRGTTVDTQYDRLVVTGNAQLSGELKVELLNRYHPVPGNTFTVLTAGSITGDFTSFDMAPLNGFLWGTEKTATEYRLKLVTGDYNADGVIDALDYTVWRNEMGTNYAVAYSGADGNGDKAVTAADYAIWKQNYGFQNGDPAPAGSGAGGIAAIVPEPAAAPLLAVACALLASRRRRSRR